MELRRAAAEVIGRAASRLVRPRPTQVCFASLPDFSDSAFAVYRHVATTRDGLDLVWLVKDARTADRIRQHFSSLSPGTGNGLEIRRWNSVRGFLSFLRSRVVFHTHGAFNFTRPSPARTVVSLWHGMPLKAIGALDATGSWRGGVWGDVHVATSRLFRTVQSAAFEVSPSSVVVTGLPRCDVLKGRVPADHDAAQVRAALGLPEHGRIVLWMPTHRATSVRAVGSSSSLDGVDPALLELLLDACADERCHLIAKLHPYDTADQRTAAALAEHPAARLLSADQWASTGIQLYDLVAAADGLVTDLSSVLVDFLHTGRPIALLGSDLDRDLTIPRASLAGSVAVSELDSAGSVRTFVEAVAQGQRCFVPPGDVAWLLNEDSSICSSERLCRLAGI